MRFPVAAIAFLLLLPSLAPAADAPPIRIDDDGPAHGVRSLDLQELWRIGGEDDDVIFGRITDLKRHPNGNTYVLDNQLCRVTVLSPDGGYLGDIGREGDGPGELRQPMGLVFLDEETLGVGMGFPGKVVSLKLDGTPGDTYYPVGEPSEGNVGVMMSLNYRDGVLAAGGARLLFVGPDDSSTLRFLATASGDLTDFHRILERKTPLDPTGLHWAETEDYYPDMSWTLGSGGTIYAPMRRDRYEISVFDRDGELQRVFGRALESRKRNDDDKRQIGPIISVNGATVRDDWKISDRDPSVTRMQIDPDTGRVWVLTGHGTNDQPDGILETWDVFSPEGEYLEQVPIPLGHAMRDGTCFLVGSGRLVVVRGTAASRFTDPDDESDEDGLEPEPLEVICYAIR